MSTLKNRIRVLEERRGDSWPMFDVWAKYGDAYCLALVRGNGREAAIEEMREHLSEEWVQGLIGFCDAMFAHLGIRPPIIQHIEYQFGHTAYMMLASGSVVPNECPR